MIPKTVQQAFDYSSKELSELNKTSSTVSPNPISKGLSVVEREIAAIEDISTPKETYDPIYSIPDDPFLPQKKDILPEDLQNEIGVIKFTNILSAKSIPDFLDRFFAWLNKILGSTATTVVGKDEAKPLTPAAPYVDYPEGYKSSGGQATEKKPDQSIPVVPGSNIW